jgi:hypothetical protein
VAAIDMRLAKASSSRHPERTDPALFHCRNIPYMSIPRVGVRRLDRRPDRLDGALFGYWNICDLNEAQLRGSGYRQAAGPRLRDAAEGLYTHGSR